jgi:hypothetical protein
MCDRDMMLLFSLYGAYFVWATVPLLPAVIIYLLFPTAPTDTQWKIPGIALKAGGASGFYFAILALAYFKFLQPAVDYVKTLEQPYWTVDAPVVFLDSEKHVINSTSTLDQLRVEPVAYGFQKTGEQSYSVQLKFPELKGEVPEHVRLIFPEGEGFIEMSKVKTRDNTDPYMKKIDLTKDKPIEIRPPLTGGQNRPVVAGLSKQLERGLESGVGSR